MCRSKRLSLLVAVGLTLAISLTSQSNCQTTVFEGARLITGDGGPPIENSAFTVEGNRFTVVGRRGELAIPAAAARVDLAGKTVIPALIDAHVHMGYRRGLTFGP